MGRQDKQDIPNRRRLLRKRLPVALLAAVVSHGAALAQSTPESGEADPTGPLRLRFEPLLRESTAAMREGRPFFLSGERLEGRAGLDSTVTGDAELRRAGAVLRADRITWYQDDNQVLAFGNVRVTREGNVFMGPQLELRLDGDQGSFLSPAYYLTQFDGRGRADRIEFLDRDRMRLSRASFTTCEPDNPDWLLEARSIDLDESRGQGTGRLATLSFMGLRSPPIPVFGFPLGDQRQSGFLPPTLSINSRSGVDVVAPYYWNIAPNRDMTFFPRASTRRGPQLGGEFRYLEPRHQGDISFEVNPQDQVTGDLRYYYQLQHGFRNVGAWSGAMLMRGVSDDEYFVDYSRSILTSADRVLPRRVQAARPVGNDWSLMVDVQKWQPILDARPGPYERVPQVQLRQVRRDFGGFDIDTTIDATQFVSPTPDGAQGARVFANPQLSWPIVRPGGSIVPRLSLHATSYQLERNAGFDTTLSRVVPTFSIDAGLVFERPATFFGQSHTQTLEPRLFYARTPYVDQSQFPVFDSATTDFSFAQLFSENTFVGHDRIADVNQLTAAAVSRLIEPSTGAERLRFAIGQRIYFSSQRVSLPGVEPPADGRSDILLAAGGRPNRTMSFDSGLQYSLESSRIPKFSAAWRWMPRDGQILNVGTRYRRDEVGQFDTSWRWPLAPRVMSMGRLNYSFLASGTDPVSGIPNERGLVESVFGLEYSSCCWISRFVLQRYVTGVDTATTAFFVQLELKGLGRIGTDPFDILRRNIPGFRIPDVRAAPASRYFGYE